MGDQNNFREPARSRNGDSKPADYTDYDPLLPVQYYERVAGGHTPSGEFRLFFAILEDALRCYVRTRNCRSGVKRAEFVDARMWFHERGTPHVFSFESVCEFLDINPDWLRARLESLGPADLPLKQFRTRRRQLARPPGPQRRCRMARSIVLSTNGHGTLVNGPTSTGIWSGSNNYLQRGEAPDLELELGGKEKAGLNSAS
jgi:hypothetical protein